ncbi:MAG: FkbM family methyltransferase [Candidatus Omnitrophica bacterium]|nr:FkbM family methyltransferase [Candidatus Omnitrophota bacterium]
MEIDLLHQTQLYIGLWEAETQVWLKKFSKKIKTAIDIGAATGEQTLYFSQKTSADIVYSFEPFAKTCEVLKNNLRLNEATQKARVEVFQKSVGEKDEGNEIRLDSLLCRSIATPCIIKMDIDGGEVNALTGAEKFFDIPQVRWLVETHSFQLEKDCLKIFETHGYKTKVIYNAWWRKFIPEQRPIEMNRWLVAYKSTDDMGS